MTVRLRLVKIAVAALTEWPGLCVRVWLGLLAHSAETTLMNANHPLAPMAGLALMEWRLLCAHARRGSSVLFARPMLTSVPRRHVEMAGCVLKVIR